MLLSSLSLLSPAFVSAASSSKVYFLSLKSEGWQKRLRVRSHICAFSISSWEEPQTMDLQKTQMQNHTSELPPENFTELGTITSISLAGDVLTLANGTELQLFPNSPGHIHEHMNGTRRMLGVFRQCSPCTCCDKTRRWCLPTVCCYNIKCGLQGLPYGLCSFIPISCTCYGCKK
ncbi:uncharacterized protein [Physcomitrium patens]|uniref:uncharacterized protein isoform X3 n=1 Tax=Physcomitrium patens TaxID=3218 RepID=UPI000D15EE3C|nr:uncharacterized protein LOC112290813 isoform X3 [Physcomitrium patens]|eukprot:XP_024393300.1 uncharacterized protein LOC112290813 isoform X3 [Physcomitrella patens]